MIVAHMIVGPGEADRYLEQVLKRTHSWADQVHVAIDPAATIKEKEIVDTWADCYSVLQDTWEDHESRFRFKAWMRLEEALNLSREDFIVCIDADEVVHEPSMLRDAAKEFPGQKISFTFHEMWSPTEYRIDGNWKPYQAAIMFPYRTHGSFRDRSLACGREPTYVQSLPPASNPVSDLLHYGYASEKDRQAKYERYMRLDGGKFHNVNHLKSILRPPALRTWEKGGLLDVGATV